MTVRLSTPAGEQSTYVITVSFFDENDDPAVPNSGLVWTLTDRDGTVINSRDQVSITPASTINIVLSGNDLAVSDPTNVGRAVTVEGTYNSSLGSNLPIKEEALFVISNFVAVPNP